MNLSLNRRLFDADGLGSFIGVDDDDELRS